MLHRSLKSTHLIAGCMEQSDVRFGLPQGREGGPLEQHFRLRTSDGRIAVSVWCHKRPSFNYLVGASDNRCRNTQSKCGSRLEVQGKFEGDRLLNRELCW